jgi:hypothetical protein
MKKYLILFLMSSVFGCSSLLASEKPTVSVTHGKYSDYYHIKYELTDNNFDLQKNDKKYVQDNGQFEIYLRKDAFPISAPNCKDMLILRMPASLSGDKDYKTSVQEKLRLYRTIEEVHDKKLQGLPVVIELNPYVRVNSKRPLSLELEQCNIFFRTKHGRYVDTLD